MRHDRWQSGVEGLTAKKLSRLKTTLRSGSELWLGTSSTEPQWTLKATQGPDDHGRTYVNGCQLSVTPSGDGAMDLIAKVNLAGGKVFIARTDEDHTELISFRHYMIVHKVDEISVIPEVTSMSVTAKLMEIVRGGSWFGIITFYVTQLPGPLAVKIPGLLLGIVSVSRTLGFGFLYPAIAVMRGRWLFCRSVIDFLTDSEGSFDFWFWAFAVSLMWPVYQCVKYLSVGAIQEATPSNAGSQRSTRLSRSSSRRSYATSRTAIDSDNDIDSQHPSPEESDDKKCCG